MMRKTLIGLLRADERALRTRTEWRLSHDGLCPSSMLRWLVDQQVHISLNVETLMEYKDV